MQQSYRLDQSGMDMVLGKTLIQTHIAGFKRLIIVGILEFTLFFQTKFKLTGVFSGDKPLLLK